MIKDIEPKNDKGQWHGYVEAYYNTGRFWRKGVYVNGYACGYCKCFDYSGHVNEDYTGYYFDDDRFSTDNVEGYCYVWSKEVVV